MAAPRGETGDHPLHLVLVAKITLGKAEDERAFGEAPRVMYIPGEIGSRLAGAKQDGVAPHQALPPIRVADLRIGADLKRARLDGVDHPCPAMVVRRPVEPLLLRMGKQHKSEVGIAVKLARRRTFRQEIRQPLFTWICEGERIEMAAAAGD